MDINWKTVVEVPGWEIRHFSLRFTNPEIERRFAVDRLERAMAGIRIFLIAGTVLYSLFGILDFYVLAEARNAAWVVRFLVVVPVLIGVLLLTFTPLFKRASQFFLGLSMFVAGLGIIAMTALTEPPGNALYYAGLIMVVTYCLNLIRLRWIFAAVLAILLTLLYQPVVLWINPIESYLILSNNFFLVMSTGVGIFACYVNELYMRRDYLHAEMLKVEKERSDELLAEAEAGSRAKSDFLGVMSHELRTPLNAILGFSEVMQHRMFGPLGSDKYDEYIDDIHSAATHLLRIITDVLDISKAEAGKIVLESEEVNLVEVMERSLRLLREQAADSGVRLSLEVGDVPQRVHADPQLMKQVFINILSNAIKFTPSGGSLHVVMDENADGSLSIRFQDTGIGIAEKDLERVLEPFVQVEGVLSRKQGGTGLGLPLVKRIMQLHNGSLKLDSKLGVGTTVTLTLPKQRMLREPQMQPQRQAIGRTG